MKGKYQRHWEKGESSRRKDGWGCEKSVVLILRRSNGGEGKKRKNGGWGGVGEFSVAIEEREGNSSWLPRRLGQAAEKRPGKDDGKPFRIEPGKTDRGDFEGSFLAMTMQTNYKLQYRGGRETSGHLEDGENWGSRVRFINGGWHNQEAYLQ